jgi:thymidylate kinase
MKNGDLKKGIFIVIEGIDGAGITTNSRLLVDWLNENQFNALYTKEPTDSPIGKLIRGYLKSSSDLDPYLMALLFTADRSLHVKNFIIPNLELGKIIVCDRYFYSTLAYQSVHGVDFNLIYKMNKNFPQPNLVLLLDVKPETAIKRKHGDKEFYENLDFLNDIRKKFLEMASDFNFVVISSNENLETVQNKIRKVTNYLIDEILERK